MNNSDRKIGLCVMCGPRSSVDVAGQRTVYVTNTGMAPSYPSHETCRACNGKGYVVLDTRR